MTSRHAHEGTEAEVVPESCHLPPRLARDLRALVELGEPAVSLTVRPEAASVTEARRFAVSLVDDWCGAGAPSDDVGLVVSELVTNAVRHSGAPVFPTRTSVYAGASGPPANGAAPESEPIRLRLLYNAPWLLCGIMDGSPVAPRRREPDYIAETGRGLHLVETFSTRWGWCGLPQGKVVWALFHCP